MKRLICCMLLIFTLSGCVKTDINKEVQSVLKKEEKVKAISYITNQKKYYSYYLPPEVGRMKSTQISEMFKKNNISFVMNLDVSSIVIDEYYTENETEEKIRKTEKNDKVKTFYGTVKNSKKETLDYSVKIEKMKNNEYYVILDTEYVDFYAIVPKTEIKNILKAEFKILKSVRIQKDLVLKDFTLKVEQKENNDFPIIDQQPDGSLTDLIVEDENNVSGEENAS